MISDCEICRNLADVETSFFKYGSPESDRPLPEAAGKLVAAEDFDDSTTRKNYVKKCPICGTLYRYVFDYEYLVNGSEDEEILARLTPEQAKEWRALRGTKK